MMSSWQLQEAKNKLTKAQLDLRNAQEIIAAKGDEINQLQNKLSQYEKEKIKSEQAPKKNAVISLRSQAIDKLSGPEVKQMLKKHNFFCQNTNWSKKWSNPDGKGIQHQYEKQHDSEVVFDGATGLYWQQSGAIDYIPYKKAEDYIAKLNRDKFAGYSDWRLPTLEEAMSLMEPTQKNGDLYIDSVFDKTQRWIWTVDKESASRPWFVGFLFGDCGGGSLDDSTYVRAVR